jgi:hypothetical protein
MMSKHAMKCSVWTYTSIEWIYAPEVSMYGSGEVYK